MSDDNFPTLDEIQAGIRKAEERFALLVSDIDADSELLQPNESTWHWNSIRRKLRGAIRVKYERPEVDLAEVEHIPREALEAFLGYQEGRDLESRLGYLEAAATNLDPFPSWRRSAADIAAQAHEARLELKAILDRAEPNGMLDQPRQEGSD